MRISASRVNSQDSLAKIIEWCKLAAATSFSQAGVQFIGLVTAIPIIRLLSTEEYAFYTIANTMLANMIILADSGISSGVMAEGGKVWDDKKTLGAIIATGLSLRKRFAIYSLMVIMPILIWLLHHHGAGWATALLISVSIIPAFMSTIQGSLLEVAPKLTQNIAPIQRVQLVTALGRFLFIGLGLLTIPFTFVICLVTGGVQLWTNRQLKVVSGAFADNDQKPDRAIESRLLQMVKRLLPDAIYMCISGQITIWLISVFGSTASVAEAGALSRLGMVLALFSAVFGLVVIPRFARMGLQRNALLGRYLQLQVMMAVIGVSLVYFVWLFADQILMILGPKYAGLHTELNLVMAGSTIYVFGQANFGLCTSKGWVIHPALTIAVSLVSIVLCASFLDVSSPRGVFTMSVIVACTHTVLHFSYGLSKIFGLKK